MKAQYYEMGRKYAQKLVAAIDGAQAKTVVTDCPLSALRIAKENGVPVMHPVEALAEAYGIRVGEPTKRRSPTDRGARRCAMKPVRRDEVLGLADYEAHPRSASARA